MALLHSPDLFGMTLLSTCSTDAHRNTVRSILDGCHKVVQRKNSLTWSARLLKDRGERKKILIGIKRTMRLSLVQHAGKSQHRFVLFWTNLKERKEKNSIAKKSGVIYQSYLTSITFPSDFSTKTLIIRSDFSTKVHDIRSDFSTKTSDIRSEFSTSC